jgi:hypothetical protein
MASQEDAGPVRDGSARKDMPNPEEAEKENAAYGECRQCGALMDSLECPDCGWEPPWEEDCE